MPRRFHLFLATSCLIVAVIAFALGAPSASAGSGWSKHQEGVGRGDARPPQPRTRWPTHGQTVSGRVKWRVAVEGARPRRVDFAVDGVVKTRLTRHRVARRGTAMLDTTKLSNGSHTLTAIAYGYGTRPPRRSRVTVKVANPAAPAVPAAPANGPGSVYWGAWIGDQLTGGQAPWDMSAVSAFEEMAHKKLSIIHFAAPFANCASQPCSYYDFPTTPMNDIRTHGAIPFFSWSSQSIPSSLNQPEFQLSDVIAGSHDSYIRSFATAAKSWGRPFFLRFNWEMNGTWFSWSERTNGNRPGEYVAAWRHVRQIFDSVGATNATWVWCPNVDPNNTLQDLGSLYPGDAYVDWTCLDGYNWGTNRAGSNPTSAKVWKSFDQLYNSTYQQIADTIAPSKPMIIGEIGSSEHGGSKAAWIEDMLARLPTYPKIRGLLWFEKFDDNMDWPLETSDAAVSAFASGIQSSAYTANDYGNTSTSPIPPPGL